MFTTVVRRTGALVVAGAVAGAVLVPVSANAATDAAGGPATGPSAGAASWIAGQLEDGLLPGQFGPEYPDYGLTIDAALSTVAVGGDDAVVQEIAAAIGENLESYITGEDFGDVGSTYAGAAGKALTFAQAAGADPTDFGGVDLVARVEGVTDDASGRIADVSDYGDNANTIGQAFAVRGLAEVGSAEAAAGTDFLLAQQCSEGFFRLELGATLAEDCDADPDATEDTDVTAFALLALLEQAGDPDVDAAVAAGVGWLEDTQADDGSFGGGAATEAPNANSTGLAGWVLGAAGADAGGRSRRGVGRGPAGARRHGLRDRSPRRRRGCAGLRPGGLRRRRDRRHRGPHRPVAAYDGAGPARAAAPRRRGRRRPRCGSAARPASSGPARR